MSVSSLSLRHRTGGLIDEARRGLGASFDALAEQHRRILYAEAYRWFSDHETALDCVQETLLRAFESLSRFRGECSFATWLFRILANVCHEEQRRQARWARQSELTDLAYELGIDEQVAARQDASAALQALAQLPLSLRTASLLSLVEGHSHAETGAILGLSVEAVKTRVRRARSLMSSLSSPKGKETAGQALSDGYRLIASLLLEQGRTAESDQALLAGVRHAPDSAYRVWQEYWIRRGSPLHDAAEEQAVRVLTQLSREPDHTSARLALGNIYHWERPSFAEAERLYASAAHDPGNTGYTATLHLAYLYAYSPQPRRAVPLLMRCRRLDPDYDTYPTLLLATTLARCRDGAALEWARQGEHIALRGASGYGDKRAYGIHTGNFRVLAAEAFRLLGDHPSARQLAFAARKAFPEDYPNAQLDALLRRLSP